MTAQAGFNRAHNYSAKNKCDSHFRYITGLKIACNAYSVYFLLVKWFIDGF